MRTITLTKAGIDLTMESVPSPVAAGWFIVAGADLAAREKVFIFLDEPGMEAAVKAAEADGGVHVLVNDDQVVASVPMEEV